ncbi:cytochrome c maturation protein CcmE [Govanella unica]|uniref:Cytochrome c-type biogenesis protein CcmE n=1 Tax=Govanella unica TaxID=2975056 RepID=A0A9X3TWH1_9PROT|nr:cytochrome c maturation protein CcmE [Govania unica]MDA5192712.1 cytochrome c maturation protein CcmE [Govania unica]
MALSRQALAKRKRMTIVALAVLALGVAVALVLSAMRDTVVFFYSPSEVAARKSDPALNLTERNFRIGGLVEGGSVKKLEGGKTTEFAVSDGAELLTVRYTGHLPDLFREGQGIVAEGRLDDHGQFIASEVLAKHDEKYMPPEVADALKKAGRWKEGEVTP